MSAMAMQPKETYGMGSLSLANQMVLQPPKARFIVRSRDSSMEAANPHIKIAQLPDIIKSQVLNEINLSGQQRANTRSLGARF